jgi:glucose/arabinose dehydrogenase
MKYLRAWALVVCLSLMAAGCVNAPPASAPDTAIQPTPTKQSPTSVATDLHIPWEVAFLPSGEMLVTERPGTLVKIAKDKKVSLAIDGVAAVGEGGLLGLALHPDFASNHWLYVYFTSRENGKLINRVERYRWDNDSLMDRTVILDDIPAGQYHDGGRLAFGPDGLLYLGTGDSGNSNLAQDKNSLAGKILRIKDDGTIPRDNPFGNAVYSYGHRNVQGLAWDDQGRLWATEHGRSGLLSGLDELNLIEKGKNYGWPVIQGDEKKDGMESPVIQSGPNVTWAPSGLAFWKGSLLFGGLRGETLYEGQISGKTVTLKEHLKGQFGRLRAVVVGPDKALYVTTSNTDGRGKPNPGDDRVIRIQGF